MKFLDSLIDQKIDFLLQTNPDGQITLRPHRLWGRVYAVPSQQQAGEIRAKLRPLAILTYICLVAVILILGFAGDGGTMLCLVLVVAFYAYRTFVFRGLTRGLTEVSPFP